MRSGRNETRAPSAMETRSTRATVGKRTRATIITIALLPRSLLAWRPRHPPKRIPFTTRRHEFVNGSDALRGDAAAHSHLGAGIPASVARQLPLDHAASFEVRSAPAGNGWQRRPREGSQGTLAGGAFGPPASFCLAVQPARGAVDQPAAWRARTPPQVLQNQVRNDYNDNMMRSGYGSSHSYMYRG